MTEGQADKLAEAAIATLIEHFDSVLILASWEEDGGTQCVKLGAGNFYAQAGMAREFVEEDVARIRGTAGMEVVEEDDDD